jgi:hypothetical protein
MSYEVVGRDRGRNDAPAFLLLYSLSLVICMNIGGYLVQKRRQHGQTSEEGTSTNEEEAGTRETI